MVVLLFHFCPQSPFAPIHTLALAPQRSADNVTLIDVLEYDANALMDFVQGDKQGLATVMFWLTCTSFRSLAEDSQACVLG